MATGNLVTRTVSGAVFLIILLSAIVIHPFGYGAILFVIAITGLCEFYGMLLPKTFTLRKILGYVIAVALLTMFYLRGFGLISEQMFWILALPVVGVFVAELYSESAEPFANISTVLTGTMYIVLPFALTTELTMPRHDGNYDYRILLSLFIFLWSNDVGAYCFGMLFGRNGKHKLFERISPKKTWEGFLGGLIAVVVAAVIVSSVWAERYAFDRIHWFVLAVVVSVAGTLGDLVESMLKRAAGVKDSGTIMPGHGGILDRFDSAICALPSAMVYIYLFDINILATHHI
jgi:phosphatidate cytidylyltransferase